MLLGVCVYLWVSVYGVLHLVDVISSVIWLGQACNHIAALLYYIHYHASCQLKCLGLHANEEASGSEENLSPVLARGMKFVKPCYGDGIQSRSQCMQRSSFDPHRPYHW